MLTRKKILLITAACALTIRLIFALIVQNSFFVSYHMVPGLDMQTLLRFSEWGGGADHPPFFTFHRIVIYLVWLIGGKVHHVWAIFAIQALLGIAAALCMADLTLKLSRSRKAALACGIISSFYLPFLVYEFSILQESFMVYFALFAFWATLNGVRKRFDFRSSVLFAAAFLAALAGRPAAIFMCAALIGFAGFKMWKRHRMKRFAVALGALAILLGACTAFNYHLAGIPSPFYQVLPYTMQFNAEAAQRDSAPEAPQPEKSLRQSAILAVKRVPTLFKSGELPENQNIYFWCEKLPELNYLPAPGLIIPLAAAGIMILIASGAWKNRYGLLLLPVIMLVLPLCARDPIGRYRLMLVPYFFVIIACAAVLFMQIKTVASRATALLAAGLGAFFSIHNGDVPQRIRPHDYSAWAMAMENTPGVEDIEVLEAYYDYWQMCRFSDLTAYRMITDKCLERNRPDLALPIAQQALDNGIEPDYVFYYMAWCFALNESPEEVFSCLLRVQHPENFPPDTYQKYTMLLRDTNRILTNMGK